MALFLPDNLMTETSTQMIWPSKLQWLTPESNLSQSRQKIWLKVTILIQRQSAKIQPAKQHFCPNDLNKTNGRMHTFGPIRHWQIEAWPKVTYHSF
jgi:hypothetical protein